MKTAYQKAYPVQSQGMPANLLEEVSIIQPAYQRISPVNIEGVKSHRLMVVLKTKGCEYARKTGGCTVCGFIQNACEWLTDDEIVEQLDMSLRTNDLSRVEEIDILTLGSFFNDSEVSLTTRLSLLEKVSKLKQVKRISVESRAEYVTVDKIRQCKAVLNGQILEFAIGLESADDYVRNKIVKKGLSKHAFRETVRKVKEAGGNLLVYLLIKPPFLSEKHAIEDAIKSAHYVFRVAREYDVSARVAFEPVFICENTLLEKLYLQSEYRLLNLWSVVEVIIKAHHYGNIFVGLSDENLSLDRMPGSCPMCYKKIVDEIERYNGTQDISRLTQIDCECKKEYLDKLEHGEI